jgi:NADPH-dependent 2,4-dienoyl-CoA reductase/sulfur reductase-like enzyme/rhodanese-related sulfurtransferase
MKSGIGKGMNTSNKRILIVGGVAGGASCAARARRLGEGCEIVVFDRGAFVSFANCGLPYFVGDVIHEERDLIVATPELFKNRFNIEVRVRHEVLQINARDKTIEVKNLNTGEVKTEPYDALVLSPGAQPIRPPLPGINLPGIYVVRTIPDSQKIREAVEKASHAVVVGAGFIGLEMAENLIRRGLAVTIVEMADQVLPPLDPEMAAMVSERLRENGIDLRLGSGVTGFEQTSQGQLRVNTSEGKAVETDFVILAIGVRPESSLAKESGLKLGKRGGIQVDQQMRTSDPNIWAVGDAVEVHEIVTDTAQMIPLAGPANRQGRIAAWSILRGECDPRKPNSSAGIFRGIQGTAVCGFFGMTVAMTGASERTLQRLGKTRYEKVYLHPGNHVSYYPGAKPIHIKLLFDTEGGALLGAQAIGEDGVARRIDVLAIAIQLKATVFDLEEAELCYAPQFGAAKDPINIAGMIAANHLRGDLPLARWEQITRSGTYLLDVRRPDEYGAGHIPRAVNIPLEKLRDRLNELPKEQEIWLVCAVGQRAYFATRLLQQGGFSVRNLPGGMQTYRAFQTMRRG